MRPLVVIVGPTAVGKSRIAVRLAHRLDGEIVSGDALQVYKGLNIGTAKLTRAEQEGIPHHMIDVVTPDQNFSVAAYRQLAWKAIEEIHQRGKLPLLVGGTGLYINSVIDNYSFPEIPTDLKLRDRLKELGLTRGRDYLHQLLKEVDPSSAIKIEPGDLRRVVRALEVFYLTGCPISSFHRRSISCESRYRLSMTGLMMERETLYSRINSRVEVMIAQGLVDEVKELLESGYSPNSNAMQALGYKEIISCLQGEYDLTTAVELIKRGTRRYAKRQMTWFKRDRRITWYSVENYITEEELVEGINQDICRTLALRVE